MNPFIKEILAQGPLITDGAWGTQLQARGLASGEFPDAWNLTQPDKVAEVASAYVNAGSRIILTNTFGANRVRLAEEPALLAKVAEINRKGVEISRLAAQGKAYVFASLGPSGKLLMDGDVSEETFLNAFSEQARAMSDAHANRDGSASLVLDEQPGD